MLDKLVIASHNKGKIREISELLSSLNITVLSAGELSIDEPEETGNSFAENATLKAKNTSEKSGLAALADDSGIVIPALDGMPGIYSARWAGKDKDFSVAFERIKNELTTKGIDPESGVSAYFVCVLCLSMPDKKEHIFEGRIDGTLTFPPRGEKGFGYDPIFIPDGYDKTFAEIPAIEKQRISHRAKAFVKFLEYLRESTDEKINLTEEV
ncbi:MAG: RdgB/HAM1 family non-canonical purine NTP pyrophosphatase [Rickettsiales bacterium]